MFNIVSRTKTKTTRTAAVPLLEAMEARRLLSASINEDGVLVVHGTKEDDTIVFALSAADAGKLDVTVNGSAHQFDVAAITGVHVVAKRGDDLIQVDGTNGPVTLSMRMLGHGGNDSLYGGDGDDALVGGKGNDDLDGERGRDDLDGGHGLDELDGGKGRDRVRGGRGSDTFHADDRGREVKDREKRDDDKELMSFDQLPVAVQDAFTAAFAGATVDEIKADEDDELIVYELEFSFGEDGEGEAEFATDGTLLSSEVEWENEDEDEEEEEDEIELEDDED